MKTLLSFAMLLAVSMAAQADDALLPLLDQDIAPGCGCSFQRFNSKESPLLRLGDEGKKKAVIRSGNKLHSLDLRQEKYIPERTDRPRPGDRLVLFAANGEWQIQVLGTAVAGACGAKKRQCGLTRYEGRMLVQHEGGARKEVPVAGNCGCE